jgi:hypothetical protein
VRNERQGELAPGANGSTATLLFAIPWIFLRPSSVKRSRLFLDTNVFEAPATPPLADHFEKISKHLSEQFIVMISPLTFDEFLLGIDEGDERYFHKDEAKIVVLRGVGKIAHPGLASKIRLESDSRNGREPGSGDSRGDQILYRGRHQSQIESATGGSGSVRRSGSV